VPYKTAAAALTDLVGGQVSMMFMDVAIGLPMAKAGKIRVLGVTTAARTPLLPDVPAISEALPNYEVVAWTAMAAPAGTPAPIIRRPAPILQLQRSAQRTCILLARDPAPQRHAGGRRASSRRRAGGRR
jgi:tripartite-type tricarboxylate transporter receptor subunit TctC